MKILENHYTDYIENFEKNNLHYIDYNLYNNIYNINNIIIYGAPGIGKYSYALNIIKNFSISTLKYEKKITINYNKSIYYFKISDIHYEIDIALLGCNSKILWNDIYNQIIDIISAKNEKTGIILCKNFNNINNELLEIFYSYMQKQYNSGILIKFIIITTDITFIPENILNSCKQITLVRPARSQYNKLFKLKLSNNYNINNINNIKDIKKYVGYNNDNSILQLPHEYICNDIIKIIINHNNIKYIDLRELLYDICIFDLNIYTCINYIIKELINKNLLDDNKLNKIMIKFYKFIKLYNNNYRPIYHLENFILYISVIINEI